LSTDPDRTVDDFEKHRPEVLVSVKLQT
jgi:hypothetical protein